MSYQNIVEVRSPLLGGIYAATLFLETLHSKPDGAVFGFPTGSSPENFYAILSGLAVTGKLNDYSFSTTNMDEYIGLHPNHPQSYYYFMKDNLFAALSFSGVACEYYIPDGIIEPSEACRAYDNILDMLGRKDIQFAGIGPGKLGDSQEDMSPHLGFNMKGDSFDLRTHVVNLDAATIEANSRFFEHIEDVPRQAITTGIKDFLNSDQLVLFAYGKSKAGSLKLALEGPISEAVPASAIRLHHNVTIIADSAALAGLR